MFEIRIVDNEVVQQVQGQLNEWNLWYKINFCVFVRYWGVLLRDSDSLAADLDIDPWELWEIVGDGAKSKVNVNSNFFEKVEQQGKFYV